MSVRRGDEGRKIYIPVLSGCCGHNNKATNWVVFQACTYVCGVFSFCSTGGKGEDVKTIIDGFIISMFIITNYTSVCVVIASSPASTFEKIMMWVSQTLLLIEAIKCLEESE